MFIVRLVPAAGPFDLEIVEGVTGGDELFTNILIAALGLLADTPGVIRNTSIPTAPPPRSSLRPFSTEDWLTTIGYGTGVQLYGGGTENVLIELTRLELVPEPAPFALVALVAIALGLRGRRSAP